MSEEVTGDPEGSSLAHLVTSPGVQFPPTPDPCSPSSRAGGGGVLLEGGPSSLIFPAHPLSELGFMLFDFSPLTAGLGVTAEHVTAPPFAAVR